MKKQLKCYIYTRVSTSMKVDSYGLDVQKDKLHKYADYHDMIIAGEYSDEGKSDKSIEGRPLFQQMLQDIEIGKDNVDFVLVFKLSRFGRNAADVLSSLQRMQDFGVNLICVEDGIDSSKDEGKLMISVLSAAAEIERENILVQTMEGHRQKAREGKWNGGLAPYGKEIYELDWDNESTVETVICSRNKILIKKATGKEAEMAAGLALQMWEENNIEDLTREFIDYINADNNIILLAMSEDKPIGFAQCGLRHDYVEGTDSSPVGYLEGIFVVKEYRKKGIAREMLKACETWAKGAGCKEFASDCELINDTSLTFHLKMGFKEANRIICFTKNLE